MEEKELLAYFGRKIKLLREKKALTQLQATIRMGKDATSISEIERGKRNVTLKTIYALSKALNVKMSDLVNFED